MASVIDTQDLHPDIFLGDTDFYSFLLVVIVVALVAAVIISRAVKTEFYDTLQKPGWAPSPGVIAVIWTVLYLLIAFATYRCWYFATPDQRVTLGWIFLIQILMNLLWIIIFFGVKNVRAARTIIVLLLLMILIQGVYMYRIDRGSGYIFLPYFAWIILMAVLNFQIVNLNQL